MTGELHGSKPALLGPAPAAAWGELFDGGDMQRCGRPDCTGVAQFWFCRECWADIEDGTYTPGESDLPPRRRIVEQEPTLFDGIAQNRHARIARDETGAADRLRTRVKTESKGVYAS